MSNESTIYVGKKYADKAEQLAVAITKETDKAVNVPQATRIAIDEALAKRVTE